MSSMLPSKIWDQFVSGNHDCFCRLFKGYYQGLYGYGLKLCNNPDLVKDSIQNLFITIWERREDYTHITSFNVYLYVSLRRHIIRSKKQQARTIDITVEVQEEFDIHFGTEELMMKKESREEQKEKLSDYLTLPATTNHKFFA